MKKFDSSLSLGELQKLIQCLLSTHFPVDSISHSIPKQAFIIALERLEYCFARINIKYYTRDTISWFDHLHGDHFCIFLWFLGNTCWSSFDLEDTAICLSLLNKRLHGADIFYSISLPKIFYFVHPLGSVLGQASYSDYFVCYQGCTIGSDAVTGYPKFTGPAVLYSHSSVIGQCVVGKDVVLPSNSHVLRTNIPSNQIVTGSYPNNVLKANNLSIIDRCFKGSQ